MVTVFVEGVKVLPDTQSLGRMHYRQCSSVLKSTYAHLPEFVFLGLDDNGMPAIKNKGYFKVLMFVCSILRCNIINLAGKSCANMIDFCY